MQAKKYVVGNWKMNGQLAQKDLAQQLVENIENLDLKNTNIGICPPFTITAFIGEIVKNTAIKLGAQDCHFAASGAHTGDISAPMLSELGASMVIVGHSERRANHFETNEIVAKKAKSAMENGLLPIICVGETEAQRIDGKAFEITLSQVEESIPAEFMADNFIIAYEPVWAIGTGRVASESDILEMHEKIRETLKKKFENAQIIPILYGGSVNAQNCGAIFALKNVDGGLIGGASLKANDFVEIIKASIDS